ncbi:M23 family metallopeptidase [Helicobacter bizzozeronii]|uniref:M23 family metallopeptidase n=1 Tax=Helicobacter bizzozeronii TaxID=56877 RepID=UPI000CF04731|nr:M23 family metallopeptidase [Helicobacter bizzozeronii]
MLLRLILIVLVMGGGYLSYNYAISQKNGAEISLTLQVPANHKAATKQEYIPNPTHWNLQYPLILTLTSKVKIRSYHIKALTSDHLVVYDHEQIVLDEPTTLSFQLPKPSIKLDNQTHLRYEIAVRDWSYANFFNGNTTTKSFEITLDTTEPKIYTLAQSGSINYGGSALVIFKVEDESLNRVWLSNGHESFKAFPFVKDKHYVAILPWSILERTFTPQIIAQDKAYNAHILTLKLIKNTKVYYPKHTIDLSKDYPSKEVALKDMEILRGLERADTRSSVRKIIQDDLGNITAYDALQFQPFNPLNKKSRVLLAFGTQRQFMFKHEKVGQRLHLGVDLAGKKSKVYASNSGKVILEEEVGGYGKSILIANGLGVYAFYGGLSEFKANMGDLLEPQGVLGLSGRNFTNKRDHVHFEILIQGVAVRPSEWMDKRFIQKFNAIIHEAERKIQAGQE